MGMDSSVKGFIKMFEKSNPGRQQRVQGPLHCLSSTAVRRPFTAIPLPFVDLARPFHCLFVDRSRPFHCLSLALHGAVSSCLILIVVAIAANNPVPCFMILPSKFPRASKGLSVGRMGAQEKISYPPQQLGHSNRC